MQEIKAIIEEVARVTCPECKCDHYHLIEEALGFHACTNCENRFYVEGVDYE